MFHFKLYSKKECGLCDKAKAAIHEFGKETPLQFEEFDITSDPAIFEKYRYDIPVLFIDGAEAARHHIGLQKLRVICKRLKD